MFVYIEFSWGVSLWVSKSVTALDVAERSCVILGFLRSGGSEGGKELLGKSVVRFIFCWSEVIWPFGMRLWLIYVLWWVILGVNKSFWSFSWDVVPEVSIWPWFGLIILGISIVTVIGEGSEEVLEINSFLPSMIEGGLSLILLD